MNTIIKFFTDLWNRFKARSEAVDVVQATPVAYAHYESPVAPSNPVKTAISEPVVVTSAPQVAEKRVSTPSDGLLKPGTPVIARGFGPGESKTFKFQRKTAGRVILKAFETVGTDVTANVTIIMGGAGATLKARNTTLDTTVEAGVHEFIVSSTGANVLAIQYTEPRPPAPPRPNPRG